MHILICKPVVAEVALSQTAMISPSAASLLSNVPSPTAFCNKSSWSAGNCSRRSFKTYALARTATTIPTLYDILGIQQDVGLLEIKSAFRQLARQHHPDVCASADAAEATTRFIQVKEAYDTLSDPNLKAAYDQQFIMGGSGSSFSFAMGAPNRRTCRRTQSASFSRQWEDQLSGLKNKSNRADCPMQESRGGSTWGARMRQKLQEDNSHVASVNQQTVAV